MGYIPDISPEVSLNLFVVLDSVEDLDYHGLELDIMVFCDKHRDNCGFVEWVDTEWPVTMQNGRVTDNLESALTIHHLTEEKNNPDANYDKLVKDVHDLINVHEERVIGFSYL
ncbi:hypothetical protein D1007_27520 [Hordeum vulgare]|nr:hypothetical protein D1007_27520 [Hordeum vulgare]